MSEEEVNDSQSEEPETRTSEAEEIDEPTSDQTPAQARDPLSIVLVAALAALLIVCVVLIFVANGHRPAGL